MTKKLKVILWCLIIGVNLSGCQGSRLQQTNVQQENGIKTNIKEVIHEENAKLKLLVDDSMYAEGIVEGFNEIFPEIEVEILLGERDEAAKRVKLDGPYGEGPDVFLQAHDQVATDVEYGMLLPIDEKIVSEISSNVTEKALKLMKVNDTTYGLPISQESMIVYYNKDIVGEQPVSSFEELFEFARVYNDVENDRYAFLTNIGDAYIAYAMLSAYGFNLFGQEGDDIDHPGIDSEELKKGLEFIKKLKSIIPVSTEELKNDFARPRFIEGKVAYIYDGPWNYEVYKESGINLGVMVIPTLEGNILTPFGGIISAHVSAYTKYPNAATLLVKYMASKNGASILYDKCREVPPLKDLYQIKGMSNDEVTLSFAKQFDVAKAMPSNKRINYYWNIMPDIIKAVFDEGMEPADAQKKLMDEWEQNVASEYFGN